ncbi:hypothetical protein TCAL_15722, partial [Tigriopus californicus]
MWRTDGLACFHPAMDRPDEEVPPTSPPPPPPRPTTPRPGPKPATQSSTNVGIRKRKTLKPSQLPVSKLTATLETVVGKLAFVASIHPPIDTFNVSESCNSRQDFRDQQK